MRTSSKQYFLIASMFPSRHQVIASIPWPLFCVPRFIFARLSSETRNPKYDSISFMRSRWGTDINGTFTCGCRTGTSKCLLLKPIIRVALRNTSSNSEKHHRHTSTHPQPKHQANACSAFLRPLETISLFLYQKQIPSTYRLL